MSYEVEHGSLRNATNRRKAFLWHGFPQVDGRTTVAPDNDGAQELGTTLDYLLRLKE